MSLIVLVCALGIRHAISPCLEEIDDDRNASEAQGSAMKIVCAWCEREGRPALMGEREPLDDHKETHGICGDHARRLMAELGPTSLAGIEVLVVVEPREVAVFDCLRDALEGVRGVRVMLERRAGNGTWPREHERRADDRQDPWGAGGLGYTMIRLGPR